MGSKAVVNMALPCAFKVTGGPSCSTPPLKNVTVPVGVPVPDNGITVAVRVMDCPTTEGFCEDEMMRFVAAPLDGLAYPPTGIEEGLPGAPVVTKMVPPVEKYGAEVDVYVSVVGANETLIVQLA